MANTQTSTRASFDLAATIALLLLVGTWASAFAAIRVGLEGGYTPYQVALLRHLTASAVLIVYAVVTRMPLPQRRDLPTIAILGGIGITFYHVALNAGQRTVPAGVSSMLIASAPIFVAVLATLFLGERLRLWGWVGIGLCVAGVAVISLRGVEGFALSTDALLVLSAAIATAIYTVGQKPVFQRYTGIQFATYAIWAGTLYLLVFLPDLPQTIATAPTNATVAVIYTGVFPSAIGYLCWSFLLSRAPASVVGSFLYFVPATAILIAWLWLGEIPQLAAFFGGTLILAGVLLVNTRGRVRSR